jgi:hypothetical protein
MAVKRSALESNVETMAVVEAVVIVSVPKSVETGNASVPPVPVRLARAAAPPTATWFRVLTTVEDVGCLVIW